MSFAAEVKQFTTKTKRLFWVIPRKIALELLRRLIMRTPFDSGRARGNWQASVGTPASGETGITDRSGSAALEAGIAVIEGWDAENVAIYLMNNVPYIVRLEDGWSGQAPNGMVKLTIAEFDFIVETTARGGV